MAHFTAETVTALIKLRDELATLIKCHYCQNVLKSARTLNCPHHVCESCAHQQLMNEGACADCNCCYFKKEITNNICINNIVETFHDLAVTIEKAAKVMNIDTKDTYKISTAQAQEDDEEKEEEDDDDDDETVKDSSSCSDSERDLKEESTSNNKRKRKRKDAEEEYFEDEPKSKKRKLSPENETIPDSANAVNEAPENYWIPTQICVTGYDKNITSQFEKYITFLDMEFTKKWSITSTDILISKSDIIDYKPNITFKVLASILCGIPVVRESFLEDSYKAQKVLNYTKYVCNYRRINQAKHGVFEGLNILFATTNMPTTKLRTLLSLGKANILETKQQIDDKNKAHFNTRIMICAHETEAYRARQLSHQYNCRVISESWVLQCIYPNHQTNENANHCLTRSNANYVNYYDMEPITKRIDFDGFDRTERTWDDSESSDDNA